MTLEELTPWLFARTSGGVRWGLDRTRELLAGVDDPHRRFYSLHIGGTNGKGSVAAMCASALRSAHRGQRIGLYTSPHLADFRERIQVDGRPVPDAAIVAAAERLRPDIERCDATFFEATTAIAFLCFAEAGADVAVVEVGLGGRLDATNVLQPLVTGVTNVGLEHTDLLGGSLAVIAREKGGIFKAGIPAVVGETGREPLDTLREAALHAGSPLHVVWEEVELGSITTTRLGTRVELTSSPWGRRSLAVPLIGGHQARNAAIAAVLLDKLPPGIRPDWSALEAGFAAVRWPGRMQLEEIAGTTFIFDVAHNPDGAAALAANLPVLDLPAPRVLVAGILADKDWQAMLQRLVPLCDAAIVTTPGSAPPGRRWDPEVPARWIADHYTIRPRVIRDLAAAVDRAATLAPHGTVIVTGSVHTVGDALGHLGVRPTGD